MTQVKQQIDIVFLAVSIAIFGAFKRSTEDDILMAGGTLPQGDILTKGGKHIFPMEKLAMFHAIKKQLMRDISKFSVKSVGGAMAFNKADIVEVEQLVKDAEKEFAAELVAFRGNYDASLAAYIAAQSNAGLADIIRQSALTVDAAISRFGFSYEMYVPQPIGDGSSIESMASNLAGRLYVEIAAAAYDVWDKSLMPSDSAGNRKLRSFGQKTKRPLVTCRDKLKKLSFLDGDIQNAIDLIDDVLAETQPQGYIVDEPGNPAQTRFIKLVKLMMDAQKFRSASTVFHGDLDAVDKLLGIAEKTVAPNLFDDFAKPDAVQVAASSVDVRTLVVAASQIPAPHNAFADFF